jgi:uncharacterized protein
VFQRASPRALLGLASACFLAFPALIPWSRALAVSNPVTAPDLSLYQSSSLASVLEYGLRSGLRMSLTLPKYFDWNLVMLACAFAGAYAERSRFFETLGERRRQIRWLCLGALAFAIVVAAVRALDGRGGGFLNDHYDIEMWFLLGQMVCFMAAICWAYSAGKLPRTFESLRFVGRMTLTHYMAQNLFGMLLFSGAGLALLHRMPYSAHVALAAVVFAVQISFSRWWLARHETGPMEWLWRRASSTRSAQPA